MIPHLSICDTVISNKNILLDCDGVLLDYVAGLKEFCMRQGIHPTSPAPLCYSMSPWLGVSNEEILDLIIAFNEEDERFAEIPAYDHAVKGVRRLKEADWTITIVTSATTTPERQQMRQDNLDRFFGEDAFDEVLFLGLREDKETALRRFQPSLWVEDNYKNALAGQKSGHQPIMINQTYNATERATSDATVLWADGLDQIAEAALLAHSRPRIAVSV